MSDERPAVRAVVELALAVFAAVLGAELWLVAKAGTDVPFYDQWGIEGGWLFPAWQDGTLRLRELFRPFNEHRILWTHLLNLGLFTANGQWDPLVELGAIAVLRAGCAATLAGWLVAVCRAGRGACWAIGLVIAVAFLPQLAWHVCLWGIESHAVFVLWFSWVALALLEPSGWRGWRTIAGGLVAVGAMLAMAIGALVPVALLGLALVRWAERRGGGRCWTTTVGSSLMLLVVASVLHRGGAGFPVSVAEFWRTLVAALSWPQPARPAAALLMSLPLLIALAGRLSRRRTPAIGEDFVLLLALWSGSVCVATAWSRGGTVELATGVPSRYADFLILLPVANIWFAWQLAREVTSARRGLAGWVTAGWTLFVVVGWLGLSAEMMRNILIPRMRDRDAPVRLVQAYAQSRDPAVFAGKPRLLVPHPNLSAIDQVLDDPRLRHRLPPSLQPDEAIGPLSRGVRAVLGRGDGATRGPR